VKVVKFRFGHQYHEYCYNPLVKAVLDGKMMLDDEDNGHEVVSVVEVLSR